MTICFALLLAGCDQSPRTDTVVPETSITFPSAGEEVNLPILVSGTAVDESGVDFVWIVVKDIERELWWTGSEWSPDFTRTRVDVVPVQGSDVQWSYELNLSDNGGSGMYQVLARSRDTSSNEDPTSAVVWFRDAETVSAKTSND